MANVAIMNELSTTLRYITDGIPIADAQARYAARRHWLLDRLSTPLLLVGPTTGPAGGYAWAHCHREVFQDPYLLYLTGINQPGVALWMDPASRDVVLFLPDKDPKREFWDGLQFGWNDPDSVALSGGLDCRYRGRLAAFVKAALGARSLGVIWHPIDGKRRSDSSWQDIKSTLSGLPLRRLVNLAALMWEQRLGLDAVDIQNLRVANIKTADAYHDLLARLRTLDSEQSASAALNAALANQTPFGLSFPTIMAAGANASVLHYTDNNRVWTGSELLLADFGARWHAVHADVSRTAPVSGQYSPLQRVLMDIVIEAQEAVYAEIKAGVTISELNEIAWRTIQRGLDRDIRQKGGVARLPYAHAPHNVSHLLGHQVHDGDPSRAYRDRPLVVGNVISNEPGLYGYFELTTGRKTDCETLGIRIEDDVLVVADGCDRLTHCAKTPDEIEARMA